MPPTVGFLNETNRDNKKIIMAAVKQRSGNLENASNRLRDDIEIVVAALNHDDNHDDLDNEWYNTPVVQFASENLQQALVNYHPDLNVTVKRLANMFALKEYQPMLGTLEEYEDVIIKLCQ